MPSNTSSTLSNPTGARSKGAVVSFPGELVETDHEYAARMRECDEAYTARCQTLKQRLDTLWGDAPPYTTQMEDSSSWVMGCLFYSWIGDFMFEAAKEKVTMETMPMPTEKYRAYNGGVILSAATRRQRELEHAWDHFVGFRVCYTGPRQTTSQKILAALTRVFSKPPKGVAAMQSPVPVGATGTLLWVGNVQQYNTGRQRYAGVEWDHVRPDADQDAHETTASLVVVSDDSPRANTLPYHAGTVLGEYLFDTRHGAATATCEKVEHVTFILPSGSAERDQNTLPARATASAPRGMSVGSALLRSLGKELLYAAPARFLRDGCTISVPMVLRYFIQYLEQSSVIDDELNEAGDVTSGTGAGGWGKGLGIVLLLFAFSLAQNIGTNKYFHVVGRCAYYYKSALSGIIFEKCMTISSKSLSLPSMNPGRIVNMLSNDVGRVEFFAWWSWVALGATAQLVASVWLLYLLVGWCTFVGLVAFILLLPLEAFLTNQMYKSFRERAEATDARLRATNEFLAGVRVVKFMSWEPSFIVNIEEKRRIEVEKIKRTQTLSVWLSFLNSAAPNLVIAIIFVLYTLMGNTLTASIVFPAISLLSVLEMPFASFPLIISGFTQFFVSMRRITRFIECQDSERHIKELSDCLEGELGQHDEHGRAASSTARRLDRDAQADMEAIKAYNRAVGCLFDEATISAFTARRLPELAPDGVHMAKDTSSDTPRGTDANASSASTPSPPSDDKREESEDTLYELKRTPILHHVNVALPRDKLTMVLGPTGSGKSSFLDAVLGALEVSLGSIAATASIAYVPQQPWVMNATVKENILLYGEFNQARLDMALASSQLKADLVLFADGLETEIGERGTNMSGGQKARVSLARAVYADKELYLLDDPLSALDAHVGERVMHECILGALAGKTRVLATHQVHFAREADYVVILSEHGHVDFAGDAAAYATYIDLQAELPRESYAPGTAPPPRQVMPAEAEARRQEEREQQERAEAERAAEAAEEEENAIQGSSLQTLAVVKGSFPVLLSEPMGTLQNRSFLGTASMLSGAEDDDDVRSVRTVFNDRHKREAMVGAKEREAARLVASSAGGTGGATANAADSTAEGGGTKHKLMTDEEKAEGAVPREVYVRYAVACGGTVKWVLIVLCHIVTEVAIVSPAVWLSLWSTDALHLGVHTYLCWYLVLTALSVLSRPLRRFYSYPILRAGCRALHSVLVRSIASATMAFYDTTPLGRIVNRFSKDMDLLDDKLQNDLFMFFDMTCTTLSSLVIMSVTQPLIIIPMIPCAYVYYRLTVFYSAANRTIRRLANLANAPVLATLTAVALGRWCIEAYGKGYYLLKEVMRRLDRVYATTYMTNVGNRWLAVRVGALSSLLVAGIALLGVWAVNKGNATQGQIGLIALSMTMAMKISLLLNEVVNFLAYVEADMNSVERIVHYVDNIEHEPIQDQIEAAIAEHQESIRHMLEQPEMLQMTSSITVRQQQQGKADGNDGGDDHYVSPRTPARGEFFTVQAGTMEFRHVDMRYRDGLPLVLRDVSFVVRPREKVGVVGRTGSGKSTLLLAFLRFVELCGGNMIVNGRDAKDYDLRDLRLLFSMIPQDPLLFDGTVRSNVDPFAENADDAIWAALRHVGIDARVRAVAGGLDGRVQEGGSNFSVGQRQLLCLARALLKRGSAFLLMDEATANVDPALDRQIQQTVHRTFREYTVVTIAHRLHTVAGYDKILLMDGGQLVESGSPRDLVSDTTSRFYSLVQSMGEEAKAKFFEELKQ